MSTKKKSQLHHIKQSNNMPLRVATGGLLATLVVGGGVAASAQKDVQLDINGQIIQASTMTGTVKDVLDSAGVQVKDQDMITPALDESVSDNDKITVRSSRQVAVVIDGQEKLINTTATNVGQLLDQLGEDYGAAGLSQPRDHQIPLDGMKLELTTPKSVTLHEGDKESTLKVPAVTVGDIFKLRGTPLGPDDVVTPSADTPVTNGMTVDVLRVQTEEKVEDRPVDPTVRREDDPNAPAGEETVVSEGKAGNERVTYKVRKENGKEVGREELHAEQLAPAEDRVIRVGTKSAAPAAPAASGNTGAAAPASANAGVWDSIAQCESGGNWSTNTGNGFSGGLQFTPSTWAGFGGTEYAPTPEQATREQQIAVAEKVQAAQGWGAWPACTSKLGIR